MGTKPQHTRSQNLEKDENALVSWITQQIETGDFTTLSIWLEDFSFEQYGRSQSTEIQKTAIQLCQICQNHQEEMDASWAAYQRAVTQEKALSANLANVLTLLLEQSEINQPVLPDTIARTEQSSVPLKSSHPNTMEPGIWQHIQNLFNRTNHEPEIVNSDSIEQKKIPASKILVSENKLEKFVEKQVEEEIITKLPKSKEGIPFLAIYLLGAFRVYQDDVPVLDWTNSKSASLFKFLLARRSEKIAKEVLMDTFWPDSSPDAARNNLNVTIYNLRKTLRNGYHNFSHVLFQDGYYLLNTKMQIWVDAEAFEQNIHAAEENERNGRFEQAIHNYHAAEALYQGEYLSEDRYDDWPMPQRQNLQDQYLRALEKLSSHFFNTGELTQSIRLCRQILSVDSCQEKAHRQLMLSYAQLGQPHLALRQFHQLSEDLQEELNVKPAPETIHILKHIQNHKRV